MASVTYIDVFEGEKLIASIKQADPTMLNEYREVYNESSTRTGSLSRISGFPTESYVISHRWTSERIGRDWLGRLYKD